MKVLALKENNWPRSSMDRTIGYGPIDRRSSRLGVTTNK